MKNPYCLFIEDPDNPEMMRIVPTKYTQEHLGQANHPNVKWYEDRYPNEPGHQATDTSRQAAEDIRPKAATLRKQVLEMIRESVFGRSADSISRELGITILSIRPRCSELNAKGLIVDSGRRDLTESGKASIIWISS